MEKRYKGSITLLMVATLFFYNIVSCETRNDLLVKMFQRVFYKKCDRKAF